MKEQMITATEHKEMRVVGRNSVVVVVLCFYLQSSEVVNGFVVSPFVPNHHAELSPKLRVYQNARVQATTVNWKGGRLGGSFPQQYRENTTPIATETNPSATNVDPTFKTNAQKPDFASNAPWEKPSDQFFVSRRESWRPNRWERTWLWADAYFGCASKPTGRRRRGASLGMTPWMRLLQQSQIIGWDSCREDYFAFDPFETTVGSQLREFSQDPCSRQNDNFYWDGDEYMTLQSLKNGKKAIKRYLKQEWKKSKQEWKNVSRNLENKLKKTSLLNPYARYMTHRRERRRRLWTTAAVVALWWCSQAWIKTATLLYAGHYWMKHRNASPALSSTSTIKDDISRMTDSGATVVQLSVALQIPNRDDKGSFLELLRQLSQTTSLTQDRPGLQRLTQIVALELLRRSSSCVSASGTCRQYDNPRQAHYDYEQIAVQERAKVHEETIHQYGGLDLANRRHNKNQQLSIDGSMVRRPTLAVITLILAFSGSALVQQQQMPTTIQSRSDLEFALSTIAAQAKVGDTLESCEILWTPTDPSQSLAMADVVADHPNLRLL